MPSEHIEQSLQRDADEHDDTRETGHSSDPLRALAATSGVRCFIESTLEYKNAPGVYVQARARSFSYPTISGEVFGLRAFTLNTWGRTYEPSQ